MTNMKQSERDVQNAIVEALLYDGWLILRVNQGARQDGGYEQDGITGEFYPVKTRYTRFAWWQMLGTDAQDSGISDVIAVKAKPARAPQCAYHDLLWLLVIEVKAPGKAKKRCPNCDGLGFTWTITCHICQGEGTVSGATAKQQAFLDAVEEHGGVAIVADCLGDIAEYLERIEEQ